MVSRRLSARALLVTALALALLSSSAAATETRLRARVVPANLLQGEIARVEGSISEARRGTRILIQERVNGWWKELARPSTRRGRFVARFRPRAAGPGVVRVLAVHPRERVRVFAVFTVFRRTEATWYGPGFFGQFTACGQRYDDSLLGVAHRTLPCGTPVTFFYGGTLLTVPVVDRGPYGSADWDLTAATAQKLGFTGRQTLGVLISQEPGE